jgi:hypothetical protein
VSTLHFIESTTAHLFAARFRQFPPSFGMTPSDRGQAMSLFGLLMDPFGGLAHLLGEGLRSCRTRLSASF